MNAGSERTEAASVTSVRSAALGVISGLILSTARAPLGIDWASIPAVGGGEMALFGAVALFAVAAWLANLPRVSVVAFLWSLFAAFAVHGLLLANSFELSSRIQLFVLVGVATIGTVPGSITRSSRARASDNAGAATREDLVIEPGTVPTFGIAIASFGAAWALYAVARPTLLLGGGLPQDDSVFASMFLLLIAFGATAFGAWFSKSERARFALPLLLALTCAVCLESLSALAKFSDRDGFESFFRSWPWSLNMLSVGTLSGDALVGARVFVLPAFVLGAALACARSPRTLASIALGAALARASWPWFVEAQSASTPDAVAELAIERVAIATAIAASGSALTLLATALAARTPPKIRAWSAGMLVGLWPLLTFTWLAPRPRVLPLSPWEIVQPKPLWLRDTAEGLLTVEVDHNGSKVATLDRHRLTPLPEEEAVEAAATARLAESADHETGEVLLVGQLTPARAAALLREGATRIHRTAPWWRSMSQIEAQLFGSTPLPAGDIVAPDLAGDAGAPTTIAFATADTAPHVTDLSDRTSSYGVIWLDAAADIAQRDWSPKVLLACSGVERLRVGIARGNKYTSGAALSAPTPLASLLRPQFERAFDNTTRTTERLARAARGTAHEQLLSGLALHYAAQVESSPFESPAEQIELDEHALELMRDAALAREPDAFVRELWSGLARTLVGKRDVERIDRHLKPLAERWAPWPELEAALAIADLEMLEPANAARRLEIAIAAAPRDADLRLLRARALVLANEPALAVNELTAAIEIAPSRRDLKRELAMARVRAGDPAGKAAVEDLLREDSKDEELKLFLGPGPLPAPRPALEPVPRQAEH